VGACATAPGPGSGVASTSEVVSSVQVRSLSALSIAEVDGAPDDEDERLDDMSRVLVKKVCEIEDREVAQSEIGRGEEYAKDQIVAISDEELRDLPLPTAKAIEIEAFVPLDSIDPIQIGVGHLAPDGQVASASACYGDRAARDALARRDL
jgi:non-homologous end joining protein Ku